MMRRLPLLLAVVAAVAGWWCLAPTTVGGHTAYVTTHGTSMQPRFHTGDLAVVRPADDYHVGQVVAYHSRSLHTVVMHRIVARHGDRFTFRGDNNDFTDLDHPTQDDFLGKLVLRIPQGGVWLARATSPPAVGLATLALLVGGSGAVHARRRRRKRPAMSRHARPSAPLPRSFTALPQPLRAGVAGATVLGVLGLALAAVSWTRPTTGSATVDTPSSRSMQFSYAAAVPPSAAYDGTVARSPDPIFRKLTDAVDVHFTYHGEPGTVHVTARLSTASGWHASVPLSTSTRIATSKYAGTVHLDLTDLQARADAAAKVTGLPSGQLDLAVVPHVVTDRGEHFDPALQLQLAPLQLKLAGDDSSLVARDTTETHRTRPVPETLGLLGRQMSVAAARILSGVLAVAGLLAAGALTLLGRRSAPASEGAVIRRRYASHLMSVQPVTTPAGRSTVDVTEFAMLARLAERYGLMVLHWTRSGVDTFVVQDEGTTYRFRTPSPSVHPETGIDCGDSEVQVAATTEIEATERLDNYWTTGQ